MDALFRFLQGLLEKFRCLIIINWFEKGIRTRGKKRWLLNAGWWGCWPFADTLYRIAVRYRLSACGRIVATSADGQTVTFDLWVGYEISDPLEMYEHIQHPEDFWIGEAPSIPTEYIAEHPMSELGPRIIREVCSPMLQEHITEHRFGFSGVRYSVKGWFVGPTFRMIGDNAWGNSGPVLETSQAVGASR